LRIDCSFYVITCLSGNDTLIAEPTDGDRDLLSEAKEECRFLITRDKGMLELPGAKEATLCLENNSTDEHARELSEKVSIDWVKAPFSLKRLRMSQKALISAPQIYFYTISKHFGTGSG
jgi:hypothetical protein